MLVAVAVVVGPVTPKQLQVLEMSVLAAFWKSEGEADVVVEMVVEMVVEVLEVRAAVVLDMNDMVVEVMVEVLEVDDALDDDEAKDEELAIDWVDEAAVDDGEARDEELLILDELMELLKVERLDDCAEV